VRERETKRESEKDRESKRKLERVREREREREANMTGVGGAFEGVNILSDILDVVSSRINPFLRTTLFFLSVHIAAFTVESMNQNEHLRKIILFTQL